MAIVSAARPLQRSAGWSIGPPVPERRGSGIGGPLFAAALEHARGRTVGLDGVLAQQERYRAAGFVAEHRTVRYALEAQSPAGNAATDLAEVPLATLTRYDRRCFGGRFLRAWTAAPGHVGRSVTRDGALAGYGLVRPCRQGAKVGPLFADDPAVAEILLDALAAAVPAGPIYVDVPVSHADAVALVEDRGITPVFETVRMYWGGSPSFDRGRVYATTTLELG
jgi:hypothetical protein